MRTLRARRELDDTAIVVLSARADDEMRVSLLAAGAQDYLVKPFSVEELRARVDNLLGERTCAREALRASEQRYAASEEERARLSARLQRAQTLEAIGTLASGVAHDFNNLLMGVSGCASMAASALDPGSPAQPALREICRAAENGAEIARQLLAFSRTRTPATSNVELDAVVAAQRQILSRLLGEDIRFEVDLRAPGCHVCADSGQLVQVLMNLCANARDAMPRGGTLELRTATVVLESGGPHGSTPGDYVTLTVADTGTGMSGETLRRILEPFFTTKAPHRGTGLGLSTVYGIVKRTGGTIDVTSAEGAGTTFTIYLPRVEAPGEAPADVTRESDEATDATGTVLLVEDDRLVRMTLRHYLETAGYRVLQAGNGPEAIACLREHAAEIDLLLTDMVLPETDGEQLAAEATALRPDIALLFMSAHGSEHLIEQGRLAPGTRTLEKPFGEELLLDHVRGALRDVRRKRPPESSA